jgi:RNA polymerase sigma-70 factor (ECF subfamily)
VTDRHLRDTWRASDPISGTGSRGSSEPDPTFRSVRDLSRQGGHGIDQAGELVKLSKRPDSFDSWYAREHPRLVATLLLSTGDIELATDGVDEAFTRALEKWNQVSVMESPTGWAFRVALNHARRTARRRAMEHRLFLRRPKIVPVPAPAGEIWQIVSGLPPRQREVVVLRHIGDLSEAEIAQVLGISRSTVSSTLSDAHDRLGNLLDGDPTSEERHRV